MHTNAFKFDSSLYQPPEEMSGMLDFENKDQDLTIKPFLQGKA